MPQVVIENPILNSPFKEPTWHFRFSATARTLWVPAVNNNGGLGRWAFVEIRDPWNTQTVTREILTVVRTGWRNGAEEATA